MLDIVNAHYVYVGLACYFIPGSWHLVLKMTTTTNLRSHKNAWNHRTWISRGLTPEIIKYISMDNHQLCQENQNLKKIV